MTSEPMDTESTARTLAAVEALLGQGNVLQAYDRAVDALRRYPADPWLRHRAVLSLARSGALAHAEHKFAQWFGSVPDSDADRDADTSTDTDPVFAIERLTLGARLIKDRVHRAPPDDRPAVARRAAEAYARAWRLALDADRPDLAAYPAVNAASLCLAAGDTTRAHDLARAVLTLPRDDSYYGHANRAEALLVLGDPDGARTALADARTVSGADPAAVAATRRQFAWILESLGRLGPTRPTPAAAGLDLLTLPAVAVFAGHMFREGCPEEAGLKARIRAHIDAQGVGIGVTALACGGDILFAESVLDAGGQLIVVLPFAARAFAAVSVEPGGESWVPRFHACLARATEVTLATEDGEGDDPELFAYGARMAAGLALHKARLLNTRAEMIALWNGGPVGGPAGTAADIAHWREATGRAPFIAPFPPLPRPTAAPATQPPLRRTLAALLFGDIHHFSRLTERQCVRYQDKVVPRLVAAIDEAAGGRVLYANTWGDGLFLGLDDIVAASRCAMALHATLESLDGTALDLPPLRMRLSGHFGPAVPLFDPIIGRRSLIGTQVIRAARIEMATPPGQTYVTNAFTAALMLRQDSGFMADYMGQVTLPKHHGVLALSALRRADGDPGPVA
ncbi:tetratricopeptide repeat-containing protein [Roseospira visakhapatnamensis]|uniref:Guanylate cyclase domain-containing protein n=1 Tax=Roseospira visakhapatnamensis TaxID=390880 RepID=A0A7W6RB76_9PROT|nr:tetratricopeptide repeat-containing protein [Roseospira visakhapatnamensis]MBB4265215.1 hypothetical protein [Roseospira visakhapatnamensis]